MTNEWIDISVPIRTGMVHWPGDPPFQIERALEMERGDVCTVSRVSMGVHTGTHMDAPLHFIRGAASIDSMPVHVTMGPARVIEIEDREFIRREELERHQIGQGERVLFKTLNSSRCWGSDEFFEDFVYIGRDGAKLLAEKKILLAGVDYLSVGGFKNDGVETHQALLGSGIWVIEGLNLSAVPAGRYELACLPLKIAGADGAPARAILRKEIE